MKIFYHADAFLYFIGIKFNSYFSFLTNIVICLVY